MGRIGRLFVVVILLLSVLFTAAGLCVLADPIRVGGSQASQHAPGRGHHHPPSIQNGPIRVGGS